MAENSQVNMTDDKVGSLYLTSKEKESIILKIQLMVRIGFPVRSKHLLDLVQKLMISENRKNNFVNNRPEKDWLDKFYDEHPEVRQALEDITKVYLRTYNALEWFENTKDFLQKQNEFKIVKQGTRIWVFDSMEFGFIKETGHYTTCTTIKQNVTTLATTFCATGEIGPNMLIYNENEKFFQRFIKEFPSNWMLKISENAQLTATIFEAYISVFVKYLQEQEIELPILLLVNGQKTPFTLEMGDFCKKKGIILYTLYLNSPNLNQPVEGDCMFCIGQAFHGIVNTCFTIEKFKKTDFLPLIKEVIEKLPPVKIRNLFRSNGIFPWRAVAVSSEFSTSKNRKKLHKKKSSTTTAVNNPTCLIPYIPPLFQQKVDAIEFLPVSMDSETLEHFDCNEENSLPCSNNKEQEKSLDSEYPQEPVTLVKIEAIDIEEDEVFPEVVEEEEEDLRGLCRVCGGTSGVMLPMFSPAGQNAHLQQKINKFLDIIVIETEDMLPRQVCHFCVSGLDACQRLADTAQATDRKLRDVVNARMVRNIQNNSTHQNMVSQETPDNITNVTRTTSKIINTYQPTVHSAKVDCVPRINVMSRSTNQRDNSEEDMDTSLSLPSTSNENKNEKDKSQNVHVFKKCNETKSDNSHLTCGICNETFPEIHNIKVHYKLKHHLYFCRYCYIIFKTNNELQNHETVHFVSCKYCNEKIRSGRYFRNHVREFHKDELPKHLNFNHEQHFRIQCKLCDIITATSIGAKTHYFWEHQKEMCDICFELFDTKVEFNTHLHEVHITTCKYCPETFYTYLSYKKSHLSIHHKTEKQKNIELKSESGNELHCTICNKTVRSKLLMKRHNYWTHKTYTCYICLNTFKKCSQEEMHYAIHGNICIYCNCQIKTKQMLSEHYINEHKNMKPYYCEFCGDSFITREELNKHRPSHTPNKGHLCDICDKDFETDTLLCQHKLVIHKPACEKNKACCPYCDKKFTFYSQLKFHITIHSDDKLLKCKDCNIQFKSLSALYVHMKTHEMYECNLCRMKFKLKNNLDSHIKCIHDNNNIIYKCTLCSKLCNSEKDIKIHINCHDTQRGDKNSYILVQGYHCDFCNAVYSKKSFIKSHIKKKHLNI